MALSKDMLIADLLKTGNVEAKAEVLFGFGMHCLGCALAKGETLEQAAVVHNVDIDVMMEALEEAENKPE